MSDFRHYLVLQSFQPCVNDARKPILAPLLAIFHLGTQYAAYNTEGGNFKFGSMKP